MRSFGEEEITEALKSIRDQLQSHQGDQTALNQLEEYIQLIRFENQELRLKLKKQKESETD